MSELLHKAPLPTEAVQGTLFEAAEFSEADLAKRHSLGGTALKGLEPIAPVLDLPSDLQTVPQSSESIHTVDTSNVAQGYLDAMDHGYLTSPVAEQQLRKVGEEAIVAEKAADTDGLTGLLNRRGMETYVQEIGEENVKGIIMLDMNGLKKINDFGSHEAGDDAIRTGGKTLEDSLWIQDGNDVSKYKQVDAKVVRLGGDEFVIVLGPDSTPEEASEVLNNIKTLPEYTSPYKLTKNEKAPDNLPSEQKISFSAGYVQEFTTFSEGLKEADTLMYADKRGENPENVPPRDERR